MGKKKSKGPTMQMSREIMEPQIQQYKKLGYVGYVDYTEKLEIMAGQPKNKARTNAFRMAGIIKKILSKDKNSVKSAYNRNKRSF